MVRVGISVEGSTEERFMKMVLAPYLADKNIYITPISMNGDVKIAKVEFELKSILYNFDYVSTFYDFYGFKGKSEVETKETLEQKIEDIMHHTVRQKLIPYVQMYEFEGLLFSSSAALASNLGDVSLVNWADNILVQFNGDPERINDSTVTAPSKRLQGNTKYRKTTHGPNIAKEIGIDGIRDKCAGFDDWLNRLENLPLVC